VGGSDSLAPTGGEGWGGRLGQVTVDLFRSARPLHQRVPDFKPNGFKLAAYLMIPEAQHLDALLGEELVSLLVSGALVRKAVPATIEFDRELCDGAVEIEEVDPARVLATEFEFIEATVA